MDTKSFLEHHVIIADDLTEQEKFEALERINILSESNLLIETSDQDIANYYKHRNKLRKIGLRKGVKSPVAAKAKVAKGAGAAVKKKSLGSKIASKLLAYMKKKGLAAKAAKLGKVAAKTM